MNNNDVELQIWAADLIDQAIADGDVVINEEGKLDLPPGVTPEMVDAEMQADRDKKKLMAVKEDDLGPQEMIILGFALEGKVDRSARWAAFRQAIGLSPKDPVPERLWTDPTRRRIANEIDEVFRGRKGNIKVINAQAMIASYQERVENDQVVGSIQGFAMAVNQIVGDLKRMHWCQNDFDIAVELLKSQTARTMVREALESCQWRLRADRPIADVVQALVQDTTEAMSLVRGRLRGAETFDTPESSFAELEEVMVQEQGRIIPTGIRALDIDLQGGHKPDDTGKLNVIGARTRVGKTTLGVGAAMGLVQNGAHVLFISCELSSREIMARSLANYSYKTEHPVPGWVMEGRSRTPGVHKNFDGLKTAWLSDQDRGSFTVKGDFQADAEAMGEYIYAAKAQNPELSAVFIDHFHIMSSSKGFNNRSQEMEARALYLHQVGKACEVDLFVLAQLNRDACLAKQPGLEHINGTDVLAQLATAVWLLEFVKATDDTPFDPSRLMLFHAKFRNGQRNADGKSINEEATGLLVNREFCSFGEFAL